MVSTAQRSARALEDNPETFWEKFSAYAMILAINPEPIGSPVLELLTPLGPILVFDRGLSPISGSTGAFVLHGQIDQWEISQQPFNIEHTGRGKYSLVGQVTEQLEQSFIVVRITPEEPAFNLVLAAQELPPVGATVRADLRPPLMAFRSEGTLR